jgi:DNA recombination protein RmuC
VGQLSEMRAHDQGEVTEALRATRQTAERLAGALRSPGVRGQWGEVQLERLIELAGLKDFCRRQPTVSGENGSLRPDCVVALPNGRELVIDAKVPLERFLAALDAADDDQRLGHLAAYAQAVRGHIRLLASKAYQKHFPARDFVVMYLPSEALFIAALEQDSELLEFAGASDVILAGPTTLLSLLRTVHVGWREQKLTENAAKIASLGGQIYKRLGLLAGHLAKLGRQLNGAVGAYNAAIGSVEHSVLVTARKFPDDYGLQAAGEIPVLDPLERAARTLKAPELTTSPLELTGADSETTRAAWAASES